MKKMRSFIKTLLLVVALTFTFTCVSLVITSCGGESNTTTINDSIKFEDQTIEYDGLKHSLFVEGLPEDVKVTYSDDNEKYPGVYPITATFTLNGQKQKLKATLTITKMASKLEANLEQTIYVYGGKYEVSYKLNNPDQKVVVKGEKGDEALGTYTTPGDYEVTIYAPESTLYAASEPVTINVHVVDSKFNLKYEDKEVTATGEAQKLLLTGTVPDGYTVEYTNNEGTEAGNYYAVAKVKDVQGTVVETHAATLVIDNVRDKAFDKYLDEFFVDYIEGDQLSVNIFCAHPENFGLEHYEAKWYTYKTPGSDEYKEAKADFEAYLEELEAFKDNKLSITQKAAYETVEAFIKYYIKYYSVEGYDAMQLRYIDSYGGYAADFTTYMEAYTFRNEQDIKDVLSYINSLTEAFPSYITYANDRVKNGYPLQDNTIEEMISYLDDVTKDGADYYLRGVLEGKIDAVTFLTNDEKAAYKTQLKDAFTNSFVPAYKSLATNLVALKGKCTTAGYWSSYEKGKDLYALELSDKLGIADLDMVQYIAKLDKEFSNASGAASSAQQIVINNARNSGVSISTYADLTAYMNNYTICNEKPIKMLDYLKEFAKTIVPELETTPNITVKEMDLATAKVSNAVAYYMKSELDNFDSEYITLNPEKLNDKNDTLSTLAHEGYPGHLFAYVYSKQLDLHNIQKIMTCTTHGEGWATYVELKLYEYAKANSTDESFRAIMDYLYAQQLSGFLLETRIDAGIHYQGWTAKDCSKFLDNNGYNGEAGEKIFNQMIEMPTTYAAYGYGKITFYEMHENAKYVLGDFYDEISINEALLSKGWTSMDILRETYNDYMAKECHKYGIVYSPLYA